MRAVSNNRTFPSPWSVRRARASLRFPRRARVLPTARMDERLSAVIGCTPDMAAPVASRIPTKSA